LGQYVETELSIPVVDTYAEYYVGPTDPGGSTQYVSAIRPELIKDGFIRVNDLDTPLEKLSTDRYDLISNKTQPGTPSCFTYDPIAPSGIVKFWPVPNLSATVKLRIVAEPFSEITSYTTELNSYFPKAYLVALRWTLAAELCPEYGQEVPPFVLAKARSAKKKVEEIILARSMTTMDLSNTISVGNIYIL